MNWSLFFQETKSRIYLIWFLGVLTIAVFATEYFPFMVPVVVFLLVVLVDYLKAVGMLMLVAVKRMTIAQFFWVDNVSALALIIIGWFLIAPFLGTTPTWLAIVLYTAGWLGVLGLVNAVFKTRKTYQSFDIKYGAADWMQSWWDES